MTVPPPYRAGFDTSSPPGWPGADPPVGPQGSPTTEVFADPAAWMRRQLFERRVVLVSGTLDAMAANQVGAALMTLDATGDTPVVLQIDSGEGTVDAALTLMDIIDLLGVPVHATCVGQAAGPALGVLAVGDRRAVSPHARLRLFEPAIEVCGPAHQIGELASAHRDRMTAFWTRLSEVTGRPVDRIRDDAAIGRYLSADEAVAYGLADEVAAPDARIHRLPGRPIGFRPR